MKKVFQFRCDPDKTMSGVENIDLDKMFSRKNILSEDNNGGLGNFYNVIQLGIQGAPGTRFWLNDAQGSDNSDVAAGIVLNWTGIFEIDLTGTGGEINSISFDGEDDTKNLYRGQNVKLIVDILYEDGGVS